MGLKITIVQVEADGAEETSAVLKTVTDALLRGRNGIAPPASIGAVALPTSTGTPVKSLHPPPLAQPGRQLQHRAARGSGESLPNLLVKCLAAQPLGTQDLVDKLASLRPDVQRTSINAMFSLAKSRGHIKKRPDGLWEAVAAAGA